MQVNNKTHILRTNEDIDILIGYLSNFKYIAADSETNGLPLDALVTGISLCAEDGLAFYVVIREWNKDTKTLDDLPNRAKVIELLNVLLTKSLIGHNFIADANWLKVNFGIELMPALHFDTLIGSHLNNENLPSYGLKQLGVMYFGESAKDEQKKMKESVIANGGIWEDKRGGNKEMFKASTDLLGFYAGQDALLTFNLSWIILDELAKQDLLDFYFTETHPLFQTATYEMNTIGMKVDLPKLKQIESDLEKECAMLKEHILFEIGPYIKDLYPGTHAKNTFNIGSGQQLSWLLFFKLGNDWKKVTKKGREVAVELLGKNPYNPAARRAFEQALRDKGIKPEKYVQCDKNALTNLAFKYKWVVKILEYKKASTLLKTYAKGMQRFVKYGVINPSFLQHGTTSGRFSSSRCNFQNLPRDDKRIKSCIVARTGKSLIELDYSQLEPRSFTSQSQDQRLMDGFRDGLDFYSVIGIGLFNKPHCTANKKDKNFFGTEYPHLRQMSKVVALSVAYGTTAYKLSDTLRDEEGKPLSIDACNKIIDDYMVNYPGVYKFIRESHIQAVRDGVVYSQFGRPRRIPEAKKLKDYGFPESCEASDLHYKQRSVLNLAVNHRVQSTAASIVNRASIEFCRRMKEKNINAYIVLQVHDSIVVECNSAEASMVAPILQDCLENTTKLAGVALIAEPKISKNLAGEAA